MVETGEEKDPQPERGAKSDAVAGLVMVLAGLPLCMLFVLQIAGMSVSSRALHRLGRCRAWRAVAIAGLAIGGLSIVCGVNLWFGGHDGIHAREMARRAACLSNLRQIMLGIKAYTPDYDGSYPTHLAPSQQGRTSYKDLGILYPDYVSALEVFTCPSSGDRMPKGLRADDRYDGKPFLPEEAQHVSYAYGLNKNARNTTWTQDPPASTRVLADRPATRTLTRTSNHKMEGRNVAFADGHVKWIAGAAPLDSDPENPDPTKHGTGPDWWSER